MWIGWVWMKRLPLNCALVPSCCGSCGSCGRVRWTVDCEYWRGIGWEGRNGRGMVVCEICGKQ